MCLGPGGWEERDKDDEASFGLLKMTTSRIN